MRHARLKPSARDTWHHCYNRAVGNRNDRPFDEADKEQFIRILHRVAALYTVRVVAYQVMSNHFHLLLQAPAEPPSEEETIRRYEDFHHGKRTLRVGSRSCREWQARLRDVSWCMRHLQHLYSSLPATPCAIAASRLPAVPHFFATISPLFLCPLPPPLFLCPLPYLLCPLPPPLPPPVPCRPRCPLPPSRTRHSQVQINRKKNYRPLRGRFPDLLRADAVESTA